LEESEKEKIYEEGQMLSALQKSADDADVLPTLDVNTDINKVLPKTDLEVLQIRTASVQMSPQPTNGINYFRALFEIKDGDLPEELQPYLPLFTTVITKLGAGSRTHKEMDQEIQKRTKGLGSKVNFAEDASTLFNFEQGVSFWSCCLEKNFEPMLGLWSEIFNDVHFKMDTAYLHQLVKIAAAEVSDSIAYEGHRVAIRRAAHSLSRSAYLQELDSGLSLANTLKTEYEQEDVSALIEKLQKIKKIVIRKENLRCSLNAEENSLATSLPFLESFLSNIPSDSLKKRSTDKILLKNTIIHSVSMVGDVKSS
jgi:Zn-dependent M16 (insulinase) family peptidase